MLLTRPNLGRKSIKRKNIFNNKSLYDTTGYDESQMIGKWSSLIRELNEYSYIPSNSTISKLKFFYGPYNQVKGFRKYMDLPKSPLESDIKDKDQLWENLSSYILDDKEATLKWVKTILLHILV